jgi:subtilisin family serine protease
MAPGQDIWTTDTPPATYNFFSGSFHAAPHVTAACALYAAVHPGASAATIKNAILSSVTDVPALHGKCAKGGVLNVEAALAQ